MDLSALHDLLRTTVGSVSTELMSPWFYLQLGIIVVTSEMPELLLLSDRILVMCEGGQTGILARENATQETVMRLAAPGMANWSQEAAS